MACLYIFNPGTMCDVQTSDILPDVSNLDGELYRMCGGAFAHFDRHTGNWYEYDRAAQNGAVPIKVLRAAGLHP